MRPIPLEVPTIDTYGIDEEITGLKVESLAYAQVRLLPSSYNFFNVSRWKKAGKKIGGLNANLGTPYGSVRGGV